MASDYRDSGGIDVQDAAVSFFSALAVIALAFLFGSLASSLGAGALVALGVATLDSPTTYVASSILQFVGFGLAVAAFLSYIDGWSVLRTHTPTLRDVAWAVVGVLSLLALSTAAGAALSSFGISPAQNQVVATGRRNPVVFLYMIPVALLFVGPFEELVFRGAAQGLLRRALGPTLAILVASALFGAVHLIALIGGNTGQLAYVGIAALLGVILGGIYERTENLLVPIAIHGIYNATLFAIQWLNTTGGGGGLPPL